MEAAQERSTALLAGGGKSATAADDTPVRVWIALVAEAAVVRERKRIRGKREWRYQHVWIQQVFEAKSLILVRSHGKAGPRRRHGCYNNPSFGYRLLCLSVDSEAVAGELPGCLKNLVYRAIVGVCPHRGRTHRRFGVVWVKGL